ncbi:alpha/beta fold hydrolase [Anthocerotibacter panamensis]|uniref:alpha/beta fold hydrolase n=1 Tax=Anthocerotibacter panamensis TaxID=2857077 RepID=UPI001C403ADC|nr:alpha/beta hydrolase [Anthocerotibacter panamensis]
MAKADLRRRTLKVTGLHISCLTVGKTGSPVILLHGGALDSASLSYKYLLAPLAQNHRVFAPDLPGYGRSDKPYIEYTLAYYLRFLGKLMDALDLERASLVGISLGGGIGLGFALRHPERVEKLVLAGSYGLGGELPLAPLAYLLVHCPLVDELVWAWVRTDRAQVRRSLENIIYRREVITEALITNVIQRLQQPGAAHAFRSLQRNEIDWRGLRTNYYDKLLALQVPTLIIHGEQDQLVPLALARQAHQRIKGSRLHILRDCGHWPVREKVEEFNQVVVEFLAG